MFDVAHNRCQPPQRPGSLVKLGFGLYKGHCLHEIPIAYLKWVVSPDGFTGLWDWLREEIEDYLDLEEDSDCDRRSL